MTGQIEDDAAIERLIQLELNALSENDLDVEEEDDEELVEEEEEEEFNSSMCDYLSAIKTYNEQASQRMLETEHVINELDSVNLNMDELLKRKLCEVLDSACEDNVMSIRNEVLRYLEEEDLKDEKEATRVEEDHELAVDIVRPDVIEEIKEIEEKAQAELQQMCKEHTLMEEKLRLFEEKRKEEDRKFDELMREKRQAKMKELADLQIIFQKNNEELNNTLQDTLDFQDNHMKMFEEDMKEKLDIINKDYMAEKERLASFQDEMTKLHAEKCNNAAITIQKHFKRYRVQKTHASELKAIKEKISQMKIEKINELIKEQERRKAEAEQKRKEQLLKEENERIEKERMEKEKEERRKKYEEQKSLVAQQRALQKHQKENKLIVQDTNSSSTRLTDDNNSKLIPKIERKIEKNECMNEDSNQGDLQNVSQNKMLQQRNLAVNNEMNSNYVSTKNENTIESKNTLMKNDRLSDQMNSYKSDIDYHDEKYTPSETTVNQNKPSTPPETTVNQNKPFTTPETTVNQNKPSTTPSETTVNQNKPSHTPSETTVNQKKPSTTPSKTAVNQNKPSNQVSYVLPQDEEIQENINVLKSNSHENVLMPQTDPNHQPSKDVVSIRDEKKSVGESPKETQYVGTSLDCNHNLRNEDNSFIKEIEQWGQAAVDGNNGKFVANVTANHIDDDSNVSNITTVEENLLSCNSCDNTPTTDDLRSGTNITNSTHSCHITHTMDDVPSEKSAFTSNGHENEADGGVSPLSPSDIENTVIPYDACFQLNTDISKHLLELYQDWLSQSMVKMEPKPFKVKPRSKRRYTGRNESSPLTEKQILDGCIGCEELRTVKVISLKSIDEKISCNPLEQCTQIECLSMEKCNVETLDGIDSCSQLKSLFVMGCNVSNVELKLSNLTHLNLSSNNLSGIHGLEMLPALICLNLSHNNILRISGLEQCHRLLHLNLDQNQIISTRGMEHLSNLIYFSCADNNVSFFEEVKRLPYLQVLNLSGNSLTKIPPLMNNILMRELYLDNNNITKIDNIHSYWLPHLTTLSIIGNCLQEVPDIGNLLSLYDLKLENNLLSNMDSLMVLQSSHNLRLLTILGNSIASVKDYRRHVKEMLPQLREIDDENVCTEKDEEKECTCLEGLCQNQKTRYEQIMKQIDTDSRLKDGESEDSILEKLKLQCICWQELHAESIKQLQEHQHLSSNKTKPVKSEEELEEHDKKKGLYASDSIPCLLSNNTDQLPATPNDTRCTDNKTVNAIKIQSLFRGYRLRKAYHNYKITTEQTPDHHSEESDFAYDEINLDEFEMNEASMEWDIPNTPQLPPKGPSLPDISVVASTKKEEVKEAWCQPVNSSPSTPSQTQVTNVRSPSICTTQTQTSGRNTSSLADTTCSKKLSKKAEILSDEWGFQNEATAELMLKRAKKLGKVKKKKTNSSDRYQLFKKGEGTSQVTVVSPDRKKAPQRISYFQGDSSPLLLDQTKQDSFQMTYRWVCNQPVLHTDRAAEVMSRNAEYFTEVESGASVHEKKQIHKSGSEAIMLPQIDPSVLAGRPLSLVQSEVHNPKPPSENRSSSGSGKARRRLQSLQKKSHSAPNCNKRNDFCITNEMGDKWKNYAYR